MYRPNPRPLAMRLRVSQPRGFPSFLLTALVAASLVGSAQAYYSCTSHAQCQYSGCTNTHSFCFFLGGSYCYYCHSCHMCFDYSCDTSCRTCIDYGCYEDSCEKKTVYGWRCPAPPGVTLLWGCAAEYVPAVQLSHLEAPTID
jgi:hypothetical protein